MSGTTLETSHGVEISSLFACQLALATDVDCVAARNNRTTNTTAHANITLVAGILTTLLPTYEQSLYCCRLRAKFLTLKVRHCRLSPTETALQICRCTTPFPNGKKAKQKGGYTAYLPFFCGFITDVFPQRIAIRLRHANRLLCPQVVRF